MKNRAAVKPMKIGRLNANVLFETWVQAYRDGDVNQLMSVFDPDLRYSEPCEPEQNFESLTSWYKYDFARKGPRPSWTFHVDSTESSGDFAVVVSTWSAVTDYNGFTADVRRLRSIDFLRHGDDGWKIFRTINDPLPCGTPAKVSRPRTAGRSRSRKAR